MKGLKGIMINPVEIVSVDRPVIKDKNYFISALLFDKKKWKKPDVLSWTKGKISINGPVSCISTGKFYRVNVSKTKPKIETRAPINPDKGIFAIMGSVDAEVDEYLENPRQKKITADVVKFILENKEKTPKEINVLLAERFKDPTGKPLHLHPGTIYKISRRKYRVSQNIDSLITKNKKEVTVNLNPLIAELTGNPAIPIYKTNWYRSRVKSMLAKGLNAYQIAQRLNKVLDKLPKGIWVKQAKARVGPGGTVGRTRKHVLTPKMVVHSILGTSKRPGIAPRTARWKLLDPKMLRGKARTIYEQTGGNMQKTLKILRENMEAIRAKRHGKAYTSPKTKQLMQTFPKVKKRKARFKKGSAAAKAWAKEMMQLRAKKGKAKFSPKVKKKYGIEFPADMTVSDLVDMYPEVANVDYDVLNMLDEIDIATLPIESFDSLDDIADAINPLIRNPNIVGLLAKLGYQAGGMVIGGQAVRLTDMIAEKITGLLPGKAKYIIAELLSDGAIYALAESFVPNQFAVAKQGVQNIVLFKFVRTLFGWFGVDIFPWSSKAIGLSEQQQQQSSTSDSKVDSFYYQNPEAITRSEKAILVVDDIAGFPEGINEIPLTEEQVGQLLTSVHGVPALGTYEPEMNIQQNVPTQF